MARFKDCGIVTIRRFSVQFFPDGAPGPDETNNLFDEFMDIMKQREEGWR